MLHLYVTECQLFYVLFLSLIYYIWLMLFIPVIDYLFKKKNNIVNNTKVWDRS